MEGERVIPGAMGHGRVGAAGRGRRATPASSRPTLHRGRPQTSEDGASYNNLITPVPHHRSTADALPLSAVVTPTTRAEGASSGMALASHVAEVYDARLLAIRSGVATRRPFPQILIPRTSERTAVIDLPAGAQSILPRLESDGNIVASLNRAGDLGFKRNLGLVLGRMCGWATTLFLDDDLRTQPASRTNSARRDMTRDNLASEPVWRLAHALTDFAREPRLYAAGYFQTDQDDNSVLCHAKRLAGERQEIFVSGGALIVRSAGPLPFFSSAYNEDWIFMFNLILSGEVTHPSVTVKHIGSVNQDVYYPFQVPRAKSEELGDLFAEGLFSLLCLPRHEVLAEAGSAAFWEHAAWSRQDMILRLLRVLRDDCSGPGMSVVHDAEESLRAALSVYSSVDEIADRLAGFFWSLLRDLETWTAFLDSFGTLRTIEEALAELDLAQFTTWHVPPGSRTPPTPQGPRGPRGVAA
jgi:hypothetical protein